MSDKTYDHTKMQGTGGRGRRGSSNEMGRVKKDSNVTEMGRDKHRKEQGRSSYEKRVNMSHPKYPSD